jgi:hypothetical protein
VLSYLSNPVVYCRGLFLYDTHGFLIAWRKNLISSSWGGVVPPGGVERPTSVGPELGGNDQLPVGIASVGAVTTAIIVCTVAEARPNSVSLF